MKVKHYSLMSGFILVAVAATLISNSTGPAAAVSGSPLEGGNNCTQCHGGTANSGAGNLQITGDDQYTPGETYSISVNVNDETSGKFGFQAIAVDEDDNAAGSLAEGTGTKTITLGGNEYIEHSSPSSNGAFTFDWTAPSTDVGDITFYASGNASNSNSQVSGDNIYTSTLTMTPATVGIEQKAQMNEVTDLTILSNGFVISSKENEKLNVLVYNLNGQLVESSAGKRVEFQLESGIYIVNALINKKTYTQKVSL